MTVGRPIYIIFAFLAIELQLLKDLMFHLGFKIFC